MESPTSRTKRWLEADGYRVAIVEKWNSFVKRRQDMFGVFDLLAFKPGWPGVVAVQACSSGDVSKRVAKIVASDLAREWRDSTRNIIVVGWAKRGKAGKKKLWTPRLVWITKEHFAGTAIALATDVDE